MRPDLGCRRNLFYVADDLRRQLPRLRSVDEFQPVDEQPLLLTQRNRRPPFPPAVIGAPRIERRPQNAYRDAPFHLSYDISTEISGLLDRHLLERRQWAAGIDVN